MDTLLPLAKQVGEKLKARKETVGVSESSAGGLISAVLLAIPGASAYFMGGAVVYFAADTGYCPYFADIARRFPRIDLALLPIGAYEPRWFMRQHHMNPEEAVRAHLDLRPRRSLGMHFGTFQLTDEPIDAPVIALREACDRAGIARQDFDVLAFGETQEASAGLCPRRASLRVGGPRQGPSPWTL